MQHILTDVSSLNMLIEIRLRCLRLIEKWISTHHPEPTKLLSTTAHLNDEWAAPSPITDISVSSVSGLVPHPLSSKSMSLWDELFRELFLSRISNLCGQALDNVLKEWTTEVLELMETASKDMTSASQTTDRMNSAEVGFRFDGCFVMYLLQYFAFSVALFSAAYRSLNI
ncbi:unnamed protein product [Dicrocoelium dendriticum]|nr:unnamed protein product [Dicrocoelium dendriticum]